MPSGHRKITTKSPTQLWAIFMHTLTIALLAVNPAGNPDTVIGDVMPVALLSGILYDVLFVKDMGAELDAPVAVSVTGGPPPQMEVGPDTDIVGGGFTVRV